MIKADTAISQAHMVEESRRSPVKISYGAGAAPSPDVVEISEECKKRLVMSNLKAALSAPDGLRGRYNR